MLPKNLSLIPSTYVAIYNYLCVTPVPEVPMSSLDSPDMVGTWCKYTQAKHAYEIIKGNNVTDISSLTQHTWGFGGGTPVILPWGIYISEKPLST